MSVRTTLVRMELPVSIIGEVIFVNANQGILAATAKKVSIFVTSSFSFETFLIQNITNIMR